MSVRHLEALFDPKSVAVVGASNRPKSVGSVVMRNLLLGGFGGPVMPVNPKGESIHGVLAYQDVDDLPVVPDLAVICTPPQTVAGILDKLGQRGTRAAVVLTAGLNLTTLPDGRTLQDLAVEAARKHHLRLLGPNCIGLVVPGIGLNASFAHANALPGKVAFVAQSGGLTTGVLDYARSNNIGFSHFLSVGDIVDVDFGDILDYLGSDPQVSAILLYIESIRDARKFMSAARAAARNKPVLVVKAGRVAEGAKAAASHTGALAGSDAVYDTAFRRAGMLRVFTITELFDAVQTLARSRPLRGDRLAILTNGGGPGVMAVDALISAGGRLAELAPETMERLNEILPVTWSHGNPVDIIGDAPGHLYADSMKQLLRDPGVDAVLVMHVITAIADVNETASAVIATSKSTNRNVLTSWLGRETVENARQAFAAAGIPTYSTPDRAVRGFMHMVQYQRNQEALTETPDSASADFIPDTATARQIILDALAAGRDMLSEPEAKSVLAAYGVPVVQTRTAATPAEAAVVAEQIGFPVVIKIISPQLSHKSDVGGVVLNLETADEVRDAAAHMLTRIARLRPDAVLEGFAVQNMARMAGAQELIVGVTTDPVFGPAILFGQGGKAVEVVGDSAIGLPPLNMSLAREQIMRTRVSKLLLGYRDEPPADLDAICLTICQVSQLVSDIAEIQELDINPLFADASGVLGLDARIKVAHAKGTGADRLAIRPYPKELEEEVVLDSGRNLVLRPIRPEDEPQHHVFISKLSPEDIRFRFFGLVREIPHSQMARLTQIDYDREMAFIAQENNLHDDAETLGVVRAVMDPDDERAEFAIIVRSDMKGQGLGRALMEKMIRYLKERGVHKVVGQVLPDNDAMLGLAETMGFESTKLPTGEAFEVVLNPLP
ncbi:MAG: bifunctional acetate--CoA ligase family protein/GNAT family N-acetyltransferase [Fimbriimonadaceae bacterium]|nr:bifunctional acetate--CoA ligase family protein/GNAT family N-acetyltransferase [Fimbriimonadaceae bacterium]